MLSAIRDRSLLTCALSLALFIGNVHSQSLSELGGDQIVTVMQTFGDKCPPPPEGQNWAPIPADVSCGSVKRCDFPNEWCAYKPGADGTPDLATLKCVKLADDCKTQFLTAVSGATPAPGGATTPAGGGETSPAGGAETSAAGGMETTAASSGGTSPAGGESSPMGVETTMAPGGGSSPPPVEQSSAAPAGGSTPAGGMGSTPSAPTGDCCDYHEFCCFWASIGQCDSNKPFMVPICKKSCGACGCSGDPASCSATVSTECNGSGNLTTTNVCPCKSGDLVNRDWHDKCGAWATKGDCDKNAQFMKPMCKKSCNICQ